MKNSNIVLFAASLLVVSVSTAEVRSADTTTTDATTTTTTKKPGIAGNLKNGTEAVFKDFGKGVKKVGHGIDTGAKDTVKVTETGAEKVGSGTKKTFSKVTHHKKTDGDTTTTTDTNTSTTQSSQ